MYKILTTEFNKIKPELACQGVQPWKCLVLVVSFFFVFYLFLIEWSGSFKYFFPEVSGFQRLGAPDDCKAIGTR